MRIVVFLLLIPLISFGQITTKEGWCTEAEQAFTANSTDAYALADSDGGEQEHYYLAWYLDGIVSAWRACGSDDNLDRAIDLTLRIIDTATDLPAKAEWGANVYKGWEATKTNNESVYGQGLWESYYWRHVATLLRVLDSSPIKLAEDNGTLRGTTYQDNYDEILAFLETHIWEKWRTYQSNGFPVYRSRTHMAAHWARIGMELYEITGTADYLTVFEEISFNGMPGYSQYAGENLRDQLYDNGTAYAWYRDWASSQIQDSSHGSDIVAFWSEAFDMGYYWSATDIAKFVNTLDDEVWAVTSPAAFKPNVDGTGTNSVEEATFGDWYALARYDSGLMSRLQTAYTDYLDVPNPYGRRRTYVMGVIALAQAYQDDEVTYPESSAAPDTTAPVGTLDAITLLTDTRFRARFTTDEPSRFSIEYGTATGVYTEETTREFNYLSSHNQYVGSNNGPALTPGTTYYFRGKTEDAAGNTGVTIEYTQTTTGSTPHFQPIRLTLSTGNVYKFYFNGSYRAL